MKNLLTLGKTQGQTFECNLSAAIEFLFCFSDFSLHKLNVDFKN